MCGIFAAIAGDPLLTHATRANHIQLHRGPDASGVKVVQMDWGVVTLGQSRLSIVDQGEVPTPWVDHTGVVVAYNGEVYNWRELRAQLPGPWETNCDVEVLARAWSQWGAGCLNRLNGMFAFIVADPNRNEVHAVRDRAGEKPMYWARKGSTTYLASEIKALPVELEPGPCLDVDTLEFDVGEDTPFVGVYSVRPGHWFSWSPNWRSEKWWELPPYEPQIVPVGYVADLLLDAIRIRLSSDVPVAVQLSGGLDSAIVQAVAQAEHLFCVSFQDVDNISTAMTAAMGRGVKCVQFTREEMLDALPDIAYHLDTPATWTAACQWFMNRRISEAGCKVVLSGEGADELFLGYSRYRILHHLDQLVDDPHLESYGPLIDRTMGNADFMVNMLNRGHGHLSRAHARSLIAQHGGDGPLVRRMARVDFYTTMQVLLRMADRMSAAHSIENRSPFFDHRLMELSTKIPVRSLIGARSKEILRKIATKIGVPDEITHERTKKGLFIPPSWGAGETWDRKWYANLSRENWLKRCTRSARVAQSVLDTDGGIMCSGPYEQEHTPKARVRTRC